MKRIIFSLIFLSLFLFFLKVNAQTFNFLTTENLETKNFKILPTNKFYFLKDFWHKVKLLFIFNPVKKADLNLEYATDKLFETKKLIEEKNVKLEVIEKQLNDFQNNLEKTKKYLENAPPKFQEKFLEHNLKHQLILQKLANQVPADVYEKIEENRLKHLKRLGEVMNKIAEKEDIVNKTYETIQKLTENKTPLAIQTVEILKNLEKITPLTLKPKIEEIENVVIKKATEEIKNLPPQERKEILKKSITSNIPNPILSFEIINDLTKNEPTLKDVTEEIKTETIKKFYQEKIKNLPNEKKEKLLEKIIEGEETTSTDVTIKKIEILKEIKQKLEQEVKEKTTTSETFQEVIEKQINKLKEEIRPEDLKTKITNDFCGISTYSQCNIDSDCIISGCSGQICQSKEEEPIATTCEWRDCYDAKRFNLKCGCYKGKCQWFKIE